MLIPKKPTEMFKRRRKAKRRTKETLDKIGALLDIGDTDELYLQSNKMLVTILENFCNRLCRDIIRPSFSLDLMLRCIIKKTHESLLAIIELVEKGHSYAAMPLLRPMCEEFLFANYLMSLNEKDADCFLKDKVFLELLQGLRAQQAFFPRAADLFGFDDFPEDSTTEDSVRELDARISAQKKKLKELGTKLGWGKIPSPSAKYMAKVTNNMAVYEFFYHASSSAVHASLHHLGRMVWQNTRAVQRS